MKHLKDILAKTRVSYNNIISTQKKFIKDNQKDLLYYFLSLFIIYIIALIPLIRANFNYMDDMGRTLLGYRGWNNFSRYGSEYLSIFIHCGRYLTDISPFPLILSIVTLCISSIILIYILSDNNKFNFWKVLAVLPIGLSPYFLECLSYKFDSIYMSISIFVGILPFLFRRKKWPSYIFISTICTILMSITYQASSGIYPMLVVILALKMWNNKEIYKDILKFIIMSAISYIVGLLVFKIVIMSPIDAVYVASTTFSIKEIFPGVINNITTYINNIKSNFTEYWLILITIISISYIITNNIKTKQKKYLSIPISIITLILTFILSFGSYLILEKPLFFPRAMYGYGVFIAIISICAIDLNKNYICKIACFLLAWLFINFSLTYGNALEEQNRYTDFRVQTLISDLNNYTTTNGEIQKVDLQGNIGKSPVIRNQILNKYAILDTLIPETFGGGWDWPEYYFYNYFDLKNIEKSDIKLDSNEMILMKDTIYHTIFKRENYILIVLK